MRPFAITAVVLIAATIFLASRIWQSEEYGPNIANSRAFYGCYASGGNRIDLNNGRAIIVGSGESTKIKRLLILKSDAVINTVNDLRLDSTGGIPHVGPASTGFFYKFDDPLKPSALVIPDDKGTEYALRRAAC